MSQGCGFGKAILFGEHFVIYGCPGIVSALDLCTVATVKRRPDQPVALRDNRRGTPGYLEAKKDQQRQSFTLMLQALGLPDSQVEINLSGELPVYSGIGASAASCVAVVRALNDEFGLGLDDEKINAVAYVGETAYHGPTHAGLDNAAATFGGLLWFLKGPPPHYEPIPIPRTVEIVMGNTGRVANTAEMIAQVSRMKNDEPARFQTLLKSAIQVTEAARNALREGRFTTVGQLMNTNHDLLQSIGVSSPELDRLVEVARQNGALGAKSTGAGGGGCMLALTPRLDLQEQVARAIEQQGFEALRARVGVAAESAVKTL